MIKDDYFKWMCNVIDSLKSDTGWNKLLTKLNTVKFYPMIPLDDNRIVDGCELRYKFSSDVGIPSTVIDEAFNEDSCSILEMMVGLSIRIEDSIMSDSDFGDRTAMWFWIMIKSLKLFDMTDSEYNDEKVNDVLNKFLNRQYDSNGSGGLFTVHNTDRDLRQCDIWHQMCLYLDKLL